MWLTLILAVDLFLAWFITNAIISTFFPFIQVLIPQLLRQFHLPSGFITLVLYVPNVLLVGFYFMFSLPKSSRFKCWSGWEYFRRNMTTVGESSHTHQQVIYAICPHGIHGEATILYFVLNKLFNSVVIVATSVLFYIPIIREFAALGGAVPANTATISHLLDEGRSIMLLPEGLRGALYAENDLRVLKGHTDGDSEPRKGFIRLALTSKNHKTLKIVPVWMHGVEHMYTVFRPIVWLQRLILKNYRYPWPLLNWGVGFWPRTDKPITIYFGKPISLTGKEVDDVFAEFVESMEELRSKGLADSQSNDNCSPP